MAGTKQQNAYAVLGLNKGATPEEIKRAYVTLVKKYDPEKHTDRFMVVQAAFDKLRDTVKRAQEDVRTINYISGEFIFNADEKSEAPDTQIEQALRAIEAKKASGEMPAEDANKRLVQGYMIRSWKKVQKKQWAEAIQDWQKVLAIDPGHRRAKNNLLYSQITLGYSYATHELYDEAVEIWTKAVGMNPDNVALLHNLALANDLAGQFDQAERFWDETVRRWKLQLTREPDNEYLKNCIIEVLRGHGENRQQQEEPQPLNAPRTPGAPEPAPAPARPAMPGAPRQGASAREAQQASSGKTMDDFREIIRLNPDDFEAHYKISTMLMKDQKWEDAVAELTKMREKWQRNVEVLNLLGWALLNSGKVDDAFTMWRKARVIEPKNYQITESLIKAHMTIGRTLRDKGLFTPCLVHFKALMNYMPDNDEVHFEIAKTYQKKGDERSAYLEYQKALKLNPKHQGAKNGLASLKLRR